MLRRLAPIAATLLLASPAGAQPSSPTVAAPTPLSIARCVWAALPATTRAALVASGPSIDDISNAITGMSPALMQLAQSQCPSPTTQTVSDAVKDAWAGTVMTNWAEGELAARFHVTHEGLARAWSHVSRPSGIGSAPASTRRPMRCAAMSPASPPNWGPRTQSRSTCSTPGPSPRPSSPP